MYADTLQFIAKGLLNPLNSVPGPWYAKWTSIPYTYKTMTTSGPKYIHALHQKYGT